MKDSRYTLANNCLGLSWVRAKDPISIAITAKGRYLIPQGPGRRRGDGENNEHYNSRLSLQQPIRWVLLPSPGTEGTVQILSLRVDSTLQHETFPGKMARHVHWSGTHRPTKHRRCFHFTGEKAEVPRSQAPPSVSSNPTALALSTPCCLPGLSLLHL